jgi:2-iminobutanoate/2-iminopropanoate deaminase
VHVNVFLEDIRDFDEMNRAYVGVSELPKPGILVTMNLTAVTRE